MRRRCDAGLVPLVGDQAVDKVDLRAPPFLDILAGGGASLIGHACQAFEHRRFDLFERLPIPPSSGFHHIGFGAPDRFEVEAERLPHRDRFPAQLN